MSTETSDRLVDYIDWNIRPRLTAVTDEETGETTRVTKCQRKDGLWQVVPMDIDIVFAVYAFATFGKI